MKSMKLVSNSKNRKIALFEKMGIFSSFLLFAVFSVYMYSPVILSHADSEDYDFKVAVGEVITLTIDNTEINMNANHGTFVSDTINVTSASNSLFGYTLTIADEDSDTRLVNSDANVEDAFSSDFVGLKTSETMGENTWGFSLNETDYRSIPASGSWAVLKRTYPFGAMGIETTAVTFGVKVGSVASGSYSDSVVFTAYVNGQNSELGIGDESIDNVSFYHIQTMQQMKPGICAATTTPLPTATEYTWDETDDNTKIPRTFLTDVRNGKVYIVEKLADGKCWMAQNLELELNNTKALTNTTTDLNSKSSWTPADSTSNDINVFEGYYCDRYDDGSLSCGFLETVEGDSSRKHLRDVSYRPPESKRFLNDGVTPSSTPSTNDGKSNWESVGYYYNWGAATAGSGKAMYEAVTDENGSISKWYPDNDEERYAADSICPKGWRLPNHNYDDEENSDIVRLNDVYYDKIDSTDIREKLGFIASGFIYPRNADADSEYDDETGEYTYFPVYTDAYHDQMSEKGVFQTSSISDYYYGESTYLAIDDNGFGWDGWSFKGVWGGAPVRCLAR